MKKFGFGKWRAIRAAVAVLVALIVVSCAHGTAASAGPQATDLVDGLWRKSEAQSFEEAKRRKVPVIIDFTAEWCPPCRVLNQTVFSDEQVRKRLAEFVPLRLDLTDKKPSDGDLLVRYQVMALPAMVVVSPEGKVVRALNLRQMHSVDQLLRSLSTL